MTIIDSLKRLERAGAEDSETNAKLRDAARDLSNLLAPMFSEGQNLPRGYHVANFDGKRAILGRAGFAVFEYRSTALAFATDLATGLLDELSEILERRTAEANVARERIEHAHDEVAFSAIGGNRTRSARRPRQWRTSPTRSAMSSG